MNNKNLLKLLDDIQEDEKDVLKDENRILIIDGLNLFLRNFAMLNFINPQGTHVGGLSGFLRSLGSLVKQIQPTAVYVIFDGIGSSLNRKSLIPEYKSGRNVNRINANIFDHIDDENESKADQIGRLIQYLRCLPIKVLSLDKVEADDIIAFLSTETTKNEKTKAYIVSSDKDFLQLVDDNITMYAAMEKEFYTPKKVKEKYGIESYNFLTYKILMGDGSDKISGVKGLGPKKLPKMFPELFEDKSCTLDDIFDIAKDKYKEHDIYCRIIMDYEKLKDNKKVMDLGNPILDDQEKEFILDIIKSPAFKLDIATFVTLYNQDGLGNILKNVEYWLRDNWTIIDRYNKVKHQ
jgi:5'-3' exonuclease